MKNFTSKMLLVVLSMLVCAGAVHAQTWTAEQTAVWEASAATWEKDKNKDDSWMTDDTHSAVSAWGHDYPAPRGRDSIVRWAKINQQSQTMVGYDLAPVAISVAGDTAIAHYYYSTASRDADGKTETTHGRCSDTMVREDGRWLFLGWSCSDEPKRD